MVSKAVTATDHSLVEHSFEHVWRGSHTEQYQALEQASLDHIQALFGRLFKGERSDDLRDALRALGWEMRSENANGVTWTVVAELDDQHGGHGLYAFSDQGRHAIEAPHVPTDSLTGEILVRYANDALPRALAWNTVRRTVADMAHSERTVFMAFSYAFAAAYPNEKLLQLHGFEAGKRKSLAGAESGTIISATHKNPSPELRDAVQCIKQRLEPDTKLYGQDVSELGATTNTIARALRSHGYQGFIHIEMNLALRKALAANADKRLILFDCLVR